MNAAVLSAFGTPAYGTFDEPTAGDGQVVVDVEVAGLNPVDLLLARGAYHGQSPTLPSVPGREGVGTVDGRRVYFTAVPPFGSMAERSLAAEAECFDLPDDLDAGVAVALGVAGLAAWLPLSWRAPVREGETVLVLGATGVLGSIAVQAAKLLGAGRVVAAGRDAAGLERATGLGADAAVDLTATDDLAATLREASGGDGPNLVVDPVWGEPGIAALEALAPFGRFLSIGNSAGPDATITSPPFRHNMSEVYGYSNFNAPLDEQREAFAAMAAHAAAGRIRVEVERVPLSDVETTWERQAAFAHRKLVLAP